MLGNFCFKYIKPWFFSGDDPERIKAPYVISLVFLLLTVWAIIMQLIMKTWQFREICILWAKSGSEAIPEIESLSKIDMSLVPLITVLIGTSGMFIGLYNWGKKERVSIVPSIKDDKVSESSKPGDGAINDSDI